MRWAALAVVLVGAAAWAEEKPAAKSEPAAAAQVSVEVNLDFSEVPEMKDWCEKAKQQVEKRMNSSSSTPGRTWMRCGMSSGRACGRSERWLRETFAAWQCFI